MDAFAVAAAVAAGLPRLTARHTFRLAWHFGFFQAAMPVLGWMGGNLLSRVLTAVAPWVAFGLLGALGVRMIWNSGQERKRNSNSMLDPTSLYGATKVCSEVLTRVYGKLYGVPYVVFRLAGVYGPGQVNGVVPAFLRSVLAGSTVGITGDGSQTRDFVFIDDVIHFLIRAMDNNITGTFNLATGVNTSINDLLDTIMLVTGASVPVEYIRSDADERSLRDISIDRLRVAFGEVPSTSLRDGLRKTWEAFR